MVLFLKDIFEVKTPSLQKMVNSMLDVQLEDGFKRSQSDLDE